MTMCTGMLFTMGRSLLFDDVRKKRLMKHSVI